MPPARFALLGTGNSTGVPWLQCVIDPETRCSVCADCMANPASKNVRNNPSGLLTYEHPDGRRRHILIDVGKSECVTAAPRTFCRRRRSPLGDSLRVE